MVQQRSESCFLLEGFSFLLLGNHLVIKQTKRPILKSLSAHDGASHHRFCADNDFLKIGYQYDGTMLIGSAVTSGSISLNIVPLMSLQDALRITKFIGAYPTSCSQTRNSAAGSSGMS
jgi:hypothetical protein